MKFRTDIEGLRAIAVSLVVAAHAKVNGLAGGFVGVDVFFVISGYLITGLLTQELVTNGRVDLARFYARRFRRLFPALFLVLVCSCLFGQQLLAIGKQPEQALAAASAIAWLSNFYFAFSDLDYFGSGGENNLFLHTWSLGVEEQFYLIWPALLLLLTTKNRPANGAVNLKWLRLAMPIISVLGFIACLVWTKANPIQAFYLMPARAWQFALGGAVFLYLDGNETQQGRVGLIRWTGWLGLAAILAAALLFDGNTSYPGALAALPTLGAAAILASGVSQQQTCIGRFLSLAPMQAIGRVSYAWYLWHWPVLLLGAAVSIGPMGPVVRAGLALLALGLAFASHALIESPLRDAVRFPIPSRRVLLITILIMFAGNGLAMHWHNRARQEAYNAKQQPYEQVRFDAPLIYTMGCDQWYHSDNVRACEFGSGRAGKTVVAIGDSVGLQWFPAIEAEFVPRDWRLLVITKSSCPMVDEPIFYSRIGRRYEECERWRTAALQMISQIRPELVIMGSTYTYDFNETQWREGTKRVLEAMAGSVGRIYILRSTPTLPFDAPSCLAPRGWLYQKFVNPNHCSAPVNHGKSDDVHRWLQSAASAFTNASVIDMTDVVCPEGLCRAQQQGLVVFRDSQHLSASFARSLGNKLGSRLEFDGNSINGTIGDVPQ